MPPLTGIMLNAVDNSLRGSANSISQFAYNAFGYLPAPIVYGFVSTIVDNGSAKKESHIPLAVILYAVIISASLATIAISRKHKALYQKQQQQEARPPAKKDEEAGDEEKSLLLAQGGRE